MNALLSTDCQEDLGWPWTSDKTMRACPVCGFGVFSRLEDTKIPVHAACLKDMVARETKQ